MSTTKGQVEALIAKAVEAKTPDDALKWSQAACNVAHALRQPEPPLRPSTA